MAEVMYMKIITLFVSTDNVHRGSDVHDKTNWIVPTDDIHRWGNVHGKTRLFGLTNNIWWW